MAAEAAARLPASARPPLAVETRSLVRRRAASCVQCGVASRLVQLAYIGGRGSTLGATGAAAAAWPAPALLLPPLLPPRCRVAVMYAQGSGSGSRFAPLDQALAKLLRETKPSKSKVEAASHAAFKLAHYPEEVVGRLVQFFSDNGESGHLTAVYVIGAVLDLERKEVDKARGAGTRPVLAELFEQRMRPLVQAFRRAAQKERDQVSKVLGRWLKNKTFPAKVLKDWASAGNCTVGLEGDSGDTEGGGEAAVAAQPSHQVPAVPALAPRIDVAAGNKLLEAMAKQVSPTAAQIVLDLGAAPKRPSSSEEDGDSVKRQRYGDAPAAPHQPPPHQPPPAGSWSAPYGSGGAYGGGTHGDGNSSGGGGGYPPSYPHPPPAGYPPRSYPPPANYAPHTQQQPPHYPAQQAPQQAQYWAPAAGQPAPLASGAYAHGQPRGVPAPSQPAPPHSWGGDSASSRAGLRERSDAPGAAPAPPATSSRLPEQPPRASSWASKPSTPASAAATAAAAPAPTAPAEPAKASSWGASSAPAASTSWGASAAAAKPSAWGASSASASAAPPKPGGGWGSFAK